MSYVTISDNSMSYVTISDNSMSYVTTERSNVSNSFNSVNFHKVLYLVFFVRVFAGLVAVSNLGIIQRY